LAPFIFPRPRRCKFKDSFLDVTGARWIQIDPGLSDSFFEKVSEFRDSIKKHFAVPLQITAAGPEQGNLLLSVRLRDKGIPPEGYVLETLRNGIHLKSCDESGAFYGLQTLRQMLLQTGCEVPEFRITDYPDFPKRGVMLDISRCKVPKMETLYRYVDIFAGLKINQLQLYTEHTFAFSGHETVWRDASPVTAEEILLLDAYCKKRCVELVPNFNSFGHFGRWLCHPEYKWLAECPDGYTNPWGGRSKHGSVLRPDDRSIRFLDSLYKEFLPNFSSMYFNVGCDETWELGQGRSKKLCEKKGTTQVYLDFLLKIEKLVRKYDRRMMFWADIILHEPKLVGKLPPDIVGLVWGYEANHPYNSQCSIFKSSRIPFYVCPGTSSWNSLTGRTSNCLGNLSSAARNGLKYGACGFLNTDWGDGGHHQYQPISYLGVCAGAACSWCRRSIRESDITRAMDELIFLDEAHVLGNLIFEMGRVLELVPKKTSNSSIFNQLLFFGKIGDPAILEGITVKDLNAAFRRFSRLEESITDCRPRASDGGLVKRELKNAIAMAKHAVSRGLAGLDKRYFAKKKMRRDLGRIIRRHEDLWLARNRRGGLRESSARLRNLLKDYR